MSSGRSSNALRVSILSTTLRRSASRAFSCVRSDSIASVRSFGPPGSINTRTSRPCACALGAVVAVTGCAPHDLLSTAQALTPPAAPIPERWTGDASHFREPACRITVERNYVFLSEPADSGHTSSSKSAPISRACVNHADSVGKQCCTRVTLCMIGVTDAS